MAEAICGEIPDWQQLQFKTNGTFSEQFANACSTGNCYKQSDSCMRNFWENAASLASTTSANYGLMLEWQQLTAELFSC